MIKLLVMDVDGTLTNGKIFIGPDGEVMKAFDVKDGYAIAHILPVYGIIPVIITGRESKIVMKRAEELKIKELHQGVSDKLSKLKEVADKYGATSKEIAYIGDDINDLDCIKYCGWTGCPADAIDVVKENSSFISRFNGGSGAVRECIDTIIAND